MQILTRDKASALGQVRLVGEGLNSIVSADEAWTRADDQGLDLVLVSDKSSPPVVRIQDFKKLEYEAKKARNKQRKNASELKEIQLKVNISDHDLDTKINAIDKFLKRGDKVKVLVRLKGRERENPQRAWELLERVKGQIDCKVTKLPGPMAMAIFENHAKSS